MAMAFCGLKGCLRLEDVFREGILCMSSVDNGSGVCWIKVRWWWANFGGDGGVSVMLAHSKYWTVDWAERKSRRLNWD